MITTDAFPETRVDPGLDQDRRYTTPETMALCMRLAGVDGWDLDVAADEESHWAERWYGVEADGLKQSWLPPADRAEPWRIWCNPPFSDIRPWVEMAIETTNHLSKALMTIGMLLPANRTEQSWWQELVELSRDDGGLLRTHFLPTRVRYGHPGNPKGIRVGSPPFASVLLVWKSE